MLAICRTGRSPAILASSSTLTGASTKVASAPASINAWAGSSPPRSLAARSRFADNWKCHHPAIDRGPDLLDHLAKWNDILALEMSALLRENLILNLNAGGARALITRTVRAIFTGLPNPVQHRQALGP